MASSSIEARGRSTPSALLITVSADGSQTVRPAQPRAGRTLLAYFPLETGVVVLVPVLVGGPCVQLRHGTFPLSWSSLRAECIDWHNPLNCLALSARRFFRVPRAAMALSGTCICHRAGTGAYMRHAPRSAGAINRRALPSSEYGRRVLSIPEAFFWLKSGINEHPPFPSSLARQRALEHFQRSR